MYIYIYIYIYYVYAYIGFQYLERGRLAIWCCWLFVAVLG